MSKEEKKMRKHIEAHANRELRKALSKARAKVSKPPRERMDVRSAEFEADNPPPPPKSNRTATVRESVAAPIARGFVAETGPGFCDVVSARPPHKMPLHGGSRNRRPSDVLTRTPPNRRYSPATHGTFPNGPAQPTHPASHSSQRGHRGQRGLAQDPAVASRPD